MYGIFFHIEVLLSLKNALAKFCFPCIVLNHPKNIPVLEGTTHGKPEYLDMRRTMLNRFFSFWTWKPLLLITFLDNLVTLSKLNELE